MVRELLTNTLKGLADGGSLSKVVFNELPLLLIKMLQNGKRKARQRWVIVLIVGSCCEVSLPLCRSHCSILPP